MPPLLFLKQRGLSLSAHQQDEQLHQMLKLEEQICDVNLFHCFYPFYALCIERIDIIHSDNLRQKDVTY